MISNKWVLLIVLLSPFLILLCVQGIFSDADTVSVSVGVVGDDDLQFILAKSDLSLYDYPTIESCKQRVIDDIHSVCIEIKNESNLVFHTDPSNIAVVERILIDLDTVLRNEVGAIQSALIQELGTQLAKNQIYVSELNRTLYDQLAVDYFSDLDFDVSIDTSSMDSSKESIQTYAAQTNQKLIEFSEQLEDIEDDLDDREEDIAQLRQQNTDCNTKYLVSEEEAALMSEEELEAQLIAFGECKCVEFYQTELEAIEDDFDDAGRDARRAKRDIDAAALANDEFMQTLIVEIDVQKNKASSLDQELQGYKQTLEDIKAQTNEQKDALRAALHQAPKAMSLDASSANFNVRIEPLSSENRFIVYIYPLIFLFIIMFVSLVLAAINTFSELRSKAAIRNALSPVTTLEELASQFIAILIIVLLQAIIILFLASGYFSLGLTFVSSIQILCATALVASCFICIGIIIGTIFNKEVLVVLCALFSSIIFLLLSNMLKPVELMTTATQTVVGLNPFMLGVRSVAKSMYYSSGLQSINLLIVECILLLFLAFIIYKLAKRKIQ
jgi:ABC-type multidrug transport system permease subunit